MKLIAMVLVLSLSACATTAPKMDCGAHLRPINPPNPVVKADAPKESTP